jgi:transposase
MKMQDKWIEPKHFVEVWQCAASLDEVAKVLQISKERLSVLAGRFRKRGVALKKFRRNASPDWKRLADLAEKLGDSTERGEDLRRVVRSRHFTGGKT